MARRSLMVNDNLVDISHSFDVPLPDKVFKINARDKSLNLPSCITDLPNYELREHLYSFKTASALGLSYGPLSSNWNLTSDDKVYISEVVKYKDIFDGNLTIRYGVGMRVFYQLKILNTEAKVSSLPLILASAQFDYIKANVEVKVIGVPTFTAPMSTTLSMESYQTIQKAVEAFQSMIQTENTGISPQILSIAYDDHKLTNVIDKYDKVSAQCFALKMIKKGCTRSHALAKCPKAPAGFRDEVDQVFSDFSSLDSNVAAWYGTRLLKNLSVTYHDKWDQSNPY